MLGKNGHTDSFRQSLRKSFNGPLPYFPEIAAEPGASIAVHSELDWNVLRETA